jgi:hypothetical protein
LPILEIAAGIVLAYFVLVLLHQFFDFIREPLEYQPPPKPPDLFLWQRIMFLIGWFASLAVCWSGLIALQLGVGVITLLGGLHMVV